MNPGAIVTGQVIALLKTTDKILARPIKQSEGM